MKKNLFFLAPYSLTQHKVKKKKEQARKSHTEVIEKNKLITGF